MELKEILQKLRKSWKLIVAFMLLGLVAAGSHLYFCFHFRQTYKASTLLFVVRTVQEPREDYYTYDGFYAQQAAYHYTDTLVGLARELGAHKVVRKSEQLVEISVVGHLDKPSQQGLLAMEQGLNSLVEKINDQFVQLGQLGDPQVKVVEIENTRSSQEVKLNTWLVLLVGVLGGVGFGTFIVAFKEYLHG